MSEKVDPVCPAVEGSEPEKDGLLQSARELAMRRCAIRMQQVVSIAELEEVAELAATAHVQQIGRAHGPFSVEVALAWDRLLRIGYRRRSHWKAAALRQ